VIKEWSKGKIKTKGFNHIPNGIIALKGGDLTEELKGVKKNTIVEIPSLFNEPYFETKKIVYSPL
jgi:16S rRNA (guanine527-N7)-methyltransferase